MSLTADKREILKKKLLYRAWHRGMLELDLSLGKFADTNINKFTDENLIQFSVILDLTENELVRICMAEKAPFPDTLTDAEQKLCNKIRSFNKLRKIRN